MHQQKDLYHLMSSKAPTVFCREEWRHCANILIFQYNSLTFFYSLSRAPLKYTYLHSYTAWALDTNYILIFIAYNRVNVVFSYYTLLQDINNCDKEDYKLNNYAWWGWSISWSVSLEISPAQPWANINLPTFQFQIN